MKKISVFLLCLASIFMFSCNANHIETTADPAGEQGNVSAKKLDSYDKIIDVYGNIAEIFTNYVDERDGLKDYASELGIVDEEEKEIFKELFGSAFDFKKSPPYRISLGYATKDLNGDGVDELVLLNNDYMVVAIFSMSDGKPVLLGNYITRSSCWIDGEGLLHENGSNGADRSTQAVYKIADGGKNLELIAEYGLNGHEWIGEVAYTKYYKLVDGEKVSITESEYRALDKQYGKYLGSVAGAEATRECSGLVFTPLFSGNLISEERALEIASEYWNIKNGDIDKDTGYRFALIPKDSDNGNHLIALLWLVENHHFSTIDMIEISVVTGEIIIPTFEPDDKG